MSLVKSASITDYSGVVINQNTVQGEDYRRAVTNDWVFQDFVLPLNYVRGVDPVEQRLPALSGIQVLTDITEGYAQAATLDYCVQWYALGTGWLNLLHSPEEPGVAIGAPYDGDEVWFEIHFDQVIDMTPDLAGARLRFGLRARTATGAINEEVPYVDGGVTLDNDIYPMALQDGVPFTTEINGVKGVVTYDASSRKAFYSVQQGITHLRYSSPSPLPGFAFAYAADGETELLHGSDNLAFNFRILGLTADDGIDFLGNRYRSVVMRSQPQHVDALDSEAKDRFWLSQPNPSRFAVESLYFDLRDIDDSPKVIDRVLLDPMTPNVYFHLYYSNEGEPGIDDKTWDDRIWTHVPKTYQARKRETHALPNPITAKYLKVEFSHLQPRPYNPGDFQVPITYKKHPKWVLDYFLLRAESDQYSPGDQFIPRRTSITYDALDLAYNYYLDDLSQEPEEPAQATPEDAGMVGGFLLDRGDFSDTITTDMADKISVAFRPYTQHPAVRGKTDFLPSTVLRGFTNDPALSATEAFRAGLDVPGSDLSNLRKDAIVYERTHPVMWFYLDCRHRYRENQAVYQYNRAYFAGVYEIVFTREQYHIESDTAQYTEGTGDNMNVDRNDFEKDSEGKWVVYDDEPEYPYTVGPNLIQSP